MRDYIFFPLAFLIAIALIAAAALPGRNRLGCGSISGAGTDYSRIEVSGNKLCSIKAAGQSEIELMGEVGSYSSVVIDAGAGLLGIEPDRNPHFRLAADLERQFSGQTVRITITARPALSKGAFAFEANYSAGNLGEAGWRAFNLTPEYNSYSFEYDIPVHVGENSVDYLAIRPVVPEKHRAVEIRSIVFERVS